MGFYRAEQAGEATYDALKTLCQAELAAGTVQPVVGYNNRLTNVNGGYVVKDISGNNKMVYVYFTAIYNFNTLSPGGTYGINTSDVFPAPKSWSGSTEGASLILNGKSGYNIFISPSDGLVKSEIDPVETLTQGSTIEVYGFYSIQTS